MTRPAWLPALPAAWTLTTLRRVSVITTGSADTINAEPDGEFPFIVRSQEPLRAADYTHDCEAILTAGDGAVGEIFHHVNGRFLAHQRVYVVSDLHGIFGRFLYYYFSTFFRFMAQDGSAKTTVASVRRWMLTDMPVAIPPECEQRAIADYLDRETAQIDALIAKQEQLVSTLRERRSATVSHAVALADGVSVQLRQLSSHAIESGYDESANSDNPQEWPRYIRTTDVATLTSLRSDIRVTVPAEAARTASVQRNDLLLTRAGSVGVSYLHESDEDAAYAGYLVRVRPRPDLVAPRYLAYWTQSRSFAAQIAQGVVRSTIENFSASKYRAMRVLIPPLGEQRRIVAALDAQTAQIDELITKAERFIVLAKERRAALITAAVTGQIAVPGVNPANKAGVSDETTKGA